MLRHYLTIGGEDISGFMQSVKIERSDSGATADFVIANIYGMFTGRWRDDGDENAKVVLLLENERHNCIGDADIRNEGADITIEIESNSKVYHAFCGYVAKVEYDDHFVKIKARTADEFLEEEAMPDGVKPTGGTAYIATPPAQIILDVISQHKDPKIGVSTLTPAEASARGYPVLQIQRSKLPGYVPPVPPGGSQAEYPPNYEYLSDYSYDKLYPDGNGEEYGWHPGTGVHGPGWYRAPGDTGGGSPGGGGTGTGPGEARSCAMVCRYKALYKCCKTTECAYKKKGTLCRQVKCPYDVEKRSRCFLLCPYDTGDCIDSTTTAEPFECPTCGGSGSSSIGGTCSTCGGSGYSSNQAVNAAIGNGQTALSNAATALTAAQNAYNQAQTPAAKEQAAINLQKAIQAYNKAQTDLDKLNQFKEKPLDEENPNGAAAAGAGDSLSGNPDDMVYVDFWDPQIIKDQVQGVKGVKYADVIRAVQRSTGGQFYINEECQAKFIPPNYVVPSNDVAIDITHLVTKQGLAKSAMSHANIVVVYGSGITEPGQSPVERERHKVIGYLQENTDSVQRHGTIHAAEVDVHYLPKQSQVEELAGNLIEFYRGDDDKAEVEAIGICPRIYQKVQWKVPIGPQMDTANCQFGSTAIMAVVSGRINKVTLDYSTKGWTVNLEVSTVEEVEGSSMMKPFVLSGDYAFATPELYDQLEQENQNNWGVAESIGTSDAGYTAPSPYWDPATGAANGQTLWVVPSADGKTLELKWQMGDSWGKVGDRPAGAYALRRLTGPTSLLSGQDPNALMSQSEV
jgi:hypothetical protein